MKFTVKQIKQINGEVHISGSKNACLPLIACCLLTKEKLILENVPLIIDVVNMIKILEKMGVSVNYISHSNTLELHAKKIKSKIICPEVGKIRASYYLMGGILPRKKKIEVAYPGGCNLGSRPIDYHLKAFKAFGCKIREEKATMFFEYKNLKGCQITFPQVSVGATINAVLVSSLSEGETLITNPALEPEVIDVVNCLKQMGANIKIESNMIHIIGVKKLKGTTYRVSFDRIEIGSYMFLVSAFPNSCLKIRGINDYENWFNIMGNVIDVLKQMNVEITNKGDCIEIKAPEKLEAVNIVTGPYPMFPTDLQPILTTCLLRAESNSVVTEEIFNQRASHVDQLVKLGADISFLSPNISIKPSKLVGSELYASDLRCGFALIIAGCMARGKTVIDNAEVILRGYENLFLKLRQLGVDIY